MHSFVNGSANDSSQALVPGVYPRKKAGTMSAITACFDLCQSSIGLEERAYLQYKQMGNIRIYIYILDQIYLVLSIIRRIQAIPENPDRAADPGPPDAE